MNRMSKILLGAFSVVFAELTEGCGVVVGHLSPTPLNAQLLYEEWGVLLGLLVAKQ